MRYFLVLPFLNTCFHSTHFLYHMQVLSTEILHLLAKHQLKGQTTMGEELPLFDLTRSAQIQQLALI